MTPAEELRAAAKSERVGWDNEIDAKYSPKNRLMHLVIADLLDKFAWTWEMDPDTQQRVGGDEVLALARAVVA